MIIRSFDQNNPPAYFTMGMTFRLDYFMQTHVLPMVLKEKITLKVREKTSFVLLDKNELMVRYKGKAIGFIKLVGNDFIFRS
jgi:hypothetical protein